MSNRIMSHKENSENLHDDPLDRESCQGSEWSSGYSSVSFRSNRSKDIDPDIDSHPPFVPESFINTYEKLIQSQKEIISQKEDIHQRGDLLRKREDLLRQREDLLHKREDLSRQQEDSLRQQEDSLCHLLQNHEALQKMIRNAVGGEQHLNCGTTHSSELKRSKLKEQQSEIEDLQRRLNDEEMQHQNTRSALKEKDVEIQDLKERSSHKEKENEDLKRKIKEKDEQLKLMRDDLNTTKEQLRWAEKLLKDEKQRNDGLRIAGEVDLALETGKTINLKNPVSKPILIDFYKDLCFDWKKKKNDLTSMRFKPKHIKDYIKHEFDRAYKDMQTKKDKINEVFQLENVKSARESSKDKEYKQLTIQNLQLCFYNKKSGPQSQNPSSADGDKAKIIESLKAEWYWLACLMALNNPPLCPDWDNPPQSADKWDIFPQTFQESDSSWFSAQGVSRMENVRHASSSDQGTSL